MVGVGVRGALSAGLRAAGCLRGEYKVDKLCVCPQVCLERTLPFFRYVARERGGGENSSNE